MKKHIYDRHKPTITTELHAPNLEQAHKECGVVEHVSKVLNMPFTWDIGVTAHNENKFSRKCL